MPSDDQPFDQELFQKFLGYAQLLKDPNAPLSKKIEVIRNLHGRAGTSATVSMPCTACHAEHLTLPLATCLQATVRMPKNV